MRAGAVGVGGEPARAGALEWVTSLRAGGYVIVIPHGATHQDQADVSEGGQVVTPIENNRRTAKRPSSSPMVPVAVGWGARPGRRVDQAGAIGGGRRNRRRLAQ